MDGRDKRGHDGARRLALLDYRLGTAAARIQPKTEIPGNGVPFGTNAASFSPGMGYEDRNETGSDT
jgi:hypothetical protein